MFVDTAPRATAFAAASHATRSTASAISTGTPDVSSSTERTCARASSPASSAPRVALRGPVRRSASATRRDADTSWAPSVVASSATNDRVAMSRSPAVLGSATPSTSAASSRARWMRRYWSACSRRIMPSNAAIAVSSNSSAVWGGRSRIAGMDPSKQHPPTLNVARKPLIIGKIWSRCALLTPRRGIPQNHGDRCAAASVRPYATAATRARRSATICCTAARPARFAPTVDCEGPYPMRNRRGSSIERVSATRNPPAGVRSFRGAR